MYHTFLFLVFPIEEHVVYNQNFVDISGLFRALLYALTTSCALILSS
jgi:hypothetical protein